MIPAPTPADEIERLAELRALQVLDTPPEHRFDRLVELAVRLFDVPIGYIALIDADRQWFKAKCGLTVDETGREVSFCGHAIMQKEPLIIPDARLDERFHDNPLVTGDPYLRFYAGHPLAGPAGHNVGTFCLADRRPRTLDERELALLDELAGLAEHELRMVDLIRTQRDLIKTKDALVQTQQHLARELAEAAEYVRTQLPAPLDTGPVRTDWRFVASSQLGGDFFSYHWLDDHRLALYVLDVCGHGVGASLLSISVHTALRGDTLGEIGSGEPGEVLAALNRAFPMGQHNEKFFTAWYGVYDTTTRQLRYASAGHPPALLIDAASSTTARLGSAGFMIGVVPEADYETSSQAIAPGSRLYLMSDGVFEFETAGGAVFSLDDLAGMLRELPPGGSRPERILGQIQDLRGVPEFTDDFSLLEVEFPPA